MKRARLIDVNDNVATCLEDCSLNDKVLVKVNNTEKIFILKQNLALGHKFAISLIKLGEYINKYGKHIGKAKQDIEIGEWVHVHNVEDHYEIT